MASDSDLVSVIVLSYRRPRQLARALDSVVAQSYPRLEILLIDNRSAASDEIAALATNYPAVRLIRNAGNEGFAAGMNRGLREAKGEFVYLTEDDVIVNTETVLRLYSYAKAHPEAGLVTGTIYREDGATVLASGGELHLGPIYRKSLHVEPTGREPFEVSYVSGSMLFARTEFLRQIGGFREGFFIYHEDDELSVRVRKRGKKLVVVPCAKVSHFDPPPGRVPEEVEFHKLKNFVSLYLLHAPLSVLPSFVLRYGLLDLAKRAARRDHFGTALKAWLWNARRVLALLQDRRG